MAQSLAPSSRVVHRLIHKPCEHSGDFQRTQELVLDCTTSIEQWAATGRGPGPAGRPFMTAGSETVAAEDHPGPACLQVAVDLPLAVLFDYGPPTGLDAVAIAPGTRVLVPFGRGERVGVVVAVTPGSDRGQAGLKALTSVLDPAPLFAAADLALIRWAADYYRHPLGEALFGALPARLRRPEPLLDPRARGWRLTQAGCGLAPEARAQVLARAPRQAAAFPHRRPPSSFPSASRPAAPP
jgi:hypothetical protein